MFYQSLQVGVTVLGVAAVVEERKLGIVRNSFRVHKADGVSMQHVAISYISDIKVPTESWRINQTSPSKHYDVERLSAQQTPSLGFGNF